MVGSVRQAALRLLRALLAAAAASIPPSANAAQPACVAVAEEAIGVAVPDARTIELADGRSLRLAGIEPMTLLVEDGDTEPALRDRIAAIASGNPLTFALTADTSDRYGRLPALAVVDKQLMQVMLVREGLAVVFATGDALPCFDDLLAAESEARRQKRGFWAKASPLPPPLPDALRPWVGRFAIFEGIVRSVGNRRDRTYLNFGEWWTEDVTVEIAAGDRESFGGETALADLAGQRVRIRGFLEEKAGPMMAVTSPMQIERLKSSSAAHGFAP